MATKVSIAELGSAVSKILTTYDRDIQKGIREETRKSMRALVAETKATAPVGHRHKHYRDSIASQVSIDMMGIYEEQWYVKGSDYRLSHLLNNGHHSRNGGWVPGTGFITKAHISVIENYQKAIEEVLQRGS